MQETRVSFVCLSVVLEPNNYPFFIKDLNFRTPKTPTSSTLPDLFPFKEHLRHLFVNNWGLCNNYQERGGAEKLEGGHYIKLLPRSGGGLKVKSVI